MTRITVSVDPIPMITAIVVFSSFELTNFSLDSLLEFLPLVSFLLFDTFDTASSFAVGPGAGKKRTK